MSGCALCKFFPSVTVNWRADTRQATVVYPMVAGSTLGGAALAAENYKYLSGYL